jgi:NAD(P)H-hydrate repair Nnr-like enzyme with NAD(P)H-hydrate dehydratase domain
MPTISTNGTRLIAMITATADRRWAAKRRSVRLTKMMLLTGHYDIIMHPQYAPFYANEKLKLFC